MKAVKVAIAAMAMASASAAVAENLIYYAEDSDGSVKYYDSDTIRNVSGGRISVWTFENAKENKTVKYRTRRVLWYIDCSSMSSSAMSFADYSSTGSLIDSNSFSYPQMRPVVPGSVGYALVEVICQR